MSGVKHRTVCVELWNRGSHFDVKKDTAISIHRGACDKRFAFDRLWLMMARFGGHWEGQWPLVSGQAYRGQQSWHEFTHSGGEPFVYWFLMCSGHIVKLRRFQQEFSFSYYRQTDIWSCDWTDVERHSGREMLIWKHFAFRLYKMNYVSLIFKTLKDIKTFWRMCCPLFLQAITKKEWLKLLHLFDQTLITVKQ